MDCCCPACVLQKVGCDYVVESSAVEDRCGVCNGDGSTCTTVRRTFEESEGLGMFLSAFSIVMTRNGDKFHVLRSTCMSYKRVIINL